MRSSRLQLGSISSAVGFGRRRSDADAGFVGSDYEVARLDGRIKSKRSFEQNSYLHFHSVAEPRIHARAACTLGRDFAASARIRRRPRAGSLRGVPVASRRSARRRPPGHARARHTTGRATERQRVGWRGRTLVVAFSGCADLMAPNALAPTGLLPSSVVRRSLSVSVAPGAPPGPAILPLNSLPWRTLPLAASWNAALGLSGAT